LHEESEWQTIFPEILENTRNNHFQTVYKDILIHENLKVQLLDYCKHKILKIVDLYSHLLPEYEKDVDELFIKVIRYRAAEANSRSQYRYVAV